jgi:hypothetical protein
MPSRRGPQAGRGAAVRIALPWPGERRTGAYSWGSFKEVS